MTLMNVNAGCSSKVSKSKLTTTTTTIRKLPAWMNQTSSICIGKDKKSFDGKRIANFKRRKEVTTENRIERTTYCMTPEEFYQYAQDIVNTMQKTEDGQVLISGDSECETAMGRSNNVSEKNNSVDAVYNSVANYNDDINLNKVGFPNNINKHQLQNVSVSANEQKQDNMAVEVSTVQSSKEIFVSDTVSVIPDSPTRGNYTFSVLDELM